MHVRYVEAGIDDGTQLRGPLRDHRANGNSRVTHGPSGCMDDSYEWAYSHGYRPSSQARYLCQVEGGCHGVRTVRSTEVVWIQVSF